MFITKFHEVPAKCSPNCLTASPKYELVKIRATQSIFAPFFPDFCTDFRTIFTPIFAQVFGRIFAAPSRVSAPATRRFYPGGGGRQPPPACRRRNSDRISDEIPPGLSIEKRRYAVSIKIRKVYGTAIHTI